MARVTRRVRQSCWVTWLVLFASVTAGCFSYQPTSAPYPEGKMVRVDLTPDGNRYVRERLGLNLLDLTGRVQTVSTDTLVLNVTLPRQTWAAGPLLQQIALPPIAVAAVRARRVNAVRTTLVSGVAAAALYLLIVSKVLHPPPISAVPARPLRLVRGSPDQG